MSEPTWLERRRAQLAQTAPQEAPDEPTPTVAEVEFTADPVWGDTDDAGESVADESSTPNDEVPGSV